MKTAKKYKAALVIVTFLVLFVALVMLVNYMGDLSGGISIGHKKPEPTPDPHEGQVYIDDGFGMVWMTPLEGVAVNPFTRSDFSYRSGKIDYHGDDYTTLRGVDVSEHQHEIDWQQVKDSGIDFAFIRVGYRGYTKGGLFYDNWADENLKGAHDAGIQVGVYFFSQAITAEEAKEEAEFTLDFIKDFQIDLPVIYDWELMDGQDDARTNNLDREILDACAIAFCDTIEEHGYRAGVYFNRHLGYYGFDLSKLTDYFLWVAVPGDHPDFYYYADVWQYSFTETVPGIEFENDLNLMFIPKSTSQAPTTAQ